MLHAVAISWLKQRWPAGARAGVRGSRPRQMTLLSLSIRFWDDPRRDAITLLVAVPLSQRALTMTEQPTIIIVDDDPGIREALGSPIRSVERASQRPGFGSRIPERTAPGRTHLPRARCQVASPKWSRFSARALGGEHSRFDNLHHRIWRHPDVRPGDKGRSDRVPTKPFRDQDLLDAVQLGLARDRAWLGERKGNRRANSFMIVGAARPSAGRADCLAPPGKPYLDLAAADS